LIYRRSLVACAHGGKSEISLDIGPIKSMTHNHCHQSCKGESRTQHHSHTKLQRARSTTKVLLLPRQSLAFYSNRVMAANLG